MAEQEAGVVSEKEAETVRILTRARVQAAIRGVKATARATKETARVTKDVLKNVGSSLKTRGNVAVKGAEISLSLLKNLSLTLIILGLVHHYFKLQLPPTVFFGSSLFLFVLSGYALAKRVQRDRAAILLPMILFVIWYFVFNANISPSFLIPYLAGSIVILLILGLLSRGESVTPEIFGFIPALFLFLDLGLLPFLVEKFSLPLTPLLENLIFWMPWWSLLGLFLLPEEVTGSEFLNTIISLTKILGLAYIAFVLVGSAVPDFGYDSAIILPGAEKLVGAQERISERLPQGENPFISNLWCILNDPQNVQGCVENRQATSRLEAICKARKLDELGYRDCLTEEKEKLLQKELQVSGIIDNTLKEITKVEVVIDEKYFPKLAYRKENEGLTINYPTTLKVENPHNLDLKIGLSCQFKKGSTVIVGEMNLNSLEKVSKHQEIPLICTPPFGEELEGKYKLTYNVTLLNMETKSFLKRAFLGERTAEEKDTLISQIRTDFFPLSTDGYSKAPNEFAYLNFGFGKTSNDPFIFADDVIIFVSSLENSGKGMVKKINSYEFNLEETGFSISSGSENCLTSGEMAIPIWNLKSPFVLPNCFLELPEDLRHFAEPFKIKTFSGKLNYDYLLRKEVDIEIKVVTP